MYIYIYMKPKPQNPMSVKNWAAREIEFIYWFRLDWKVVVLLKCERDRQTDNTRRQTDLQTATGEKTKQDKRAHNDLNIFEGQDPTNGRWCRRYRGKSETQTFIFTDGWIPKHKLKSQRRTYQQIRDTFLSDPITDDPVLKLNSLSRPFLWSINLTLCMLDVVWQSDSGRDDNRAAVRRGQDVLGAIREARNDQPQHLPPAISRKLPQIAPTFQSKSLAKKSAHMIIYYFCLS